MEETESLAGLRREMNRELFEELGSLQCPVEEILGYVGTTEKKLAAWCRRTYRRPLREMLAMIRMDGLIAIRRASFEQLKKSATIISQQYNRFLPDAGKDPRENAEAAVRALSAAISPDREELRALFPNTAPFDPAPAAEEGEGEG